MPNDQVLRWAAEAVGGTPVVSSEGLTQVSTARSCTFRLGIEGPAAQTTDVILKVPVRGWIAAAWVITNARALQLAETHGLAAPRLIAADLDGRANGTVTTLETFLPGSAGLRPTVSVARLREAGAALARVHAFGLVPQAHLPYRPRPGAVDDRADERCRGLMPTTPLLQQADERVRSHGMPAVASASVHGDVWAGNMLWEGDRCAALIDWNTAGAGNPGVDLGSLRMQMALQYGHVPLSHVLEGWERQAGREAVDVPDWDAVAALNTPTVMDGWAGFADDGSPLGAAAVTERRDAFLRTALGQWS